MKTRFLITILLSLLCTGIIAQFTEMAPMPERVTNNAVVEGYQNGIPYVYSFGGLDSYKTL